MESTDSSAGRSHHLNLPPGFRFHPTDEELVVHYLKKKATSSPLPVSIIAEVDLYKYDPWELPGKAIFGEHDEWYFFSPRDRKYPNGARPNRAATSGYWKATGNDKPVMTAGGTQKVGLKKALVFYGGKPPKGVKTDWIMHEYRLIDDKITSNEPVGFGLASKKNSLRLDDWVLCRIYKKSNTSKGLMGQEDKPDDSSAVVDEFRVNDVVGINSNEFYLPNKTSSSTFSTSGSALVDNSEQALYELGLMSTASNDNTSSMSQLACSSSPSKRPLPHPHFYWLDGEGRRDYLSSKRGCPHFLQGGSNLGDVVSLHGYHAQLQVPSQMASLPHQLSRHQVGDDELWQQPYQLVAASSLNWDPT